MTCSSVLAEIFVFFLLGASPSFAPNLFFLLKPGCAVTGRLVIAGLLMLRLRPTVFSVLGDFALSDN
jgi:hypothetical protein